MPSGGSRGLPIKGQAWPGTHLISARDSLGACIPESQACFLHGILSRPEESLGLGTVPHTSSISSKKKKKKKVISRPADGREAKAFCIDLSTAGGH